MSFTVNPVIVDRNSSKNLNKIKNSITSSIRKLKVTTSIDIAKYINETTIEDTQKPSPILSE
jgi:hypothetical protein